MMRIKLFVLICGLFFPLLSHGFVIFSPGQVAKSADFNANFSNLDGRLKKVEAASVYVTAQVNGVNMQVYSYSFGTYNIKTPTGVNLNVNESGNLGYGQLYYTTVDCTGQPYFATQLADQAVGYIFPNPKLGNKAISMAQDASNVAYYSDQTSLVRLQYQSAHYSSSTACIKTSGVNLANLALLNDVVVTGVNSFPLLITGVGTSMLVSSEVGTPPAPAPINSTYIVYANGVRIGTTITPPPGYAGTSAEGYVYQVALDNYPGETIRLYRDGTYWGFSTGSKETLYYLTNNCTGNAYVKVLTNYDKNWWKGSKTITGQIVNQGVTYDLGTQIYKMPAGSLSEKRHYGTGCTAVARVVKDGYKIATVAVQPNIPVFAPPITIGNWTEETQYNLLPAAF